MKVFGYFLFLLFILSNKSIETTYSINSILDYLQRTRYYDLLQAVKIQFGDDIAIDVCEALIQSSDCETIVRVYMTDGGNRLLGEFEEIRPIQPTVPEPKPMEEKPEQIIQRLLDKRIISNENVLPVVDFIIINFYDVLEDNMDQTEIEGFFKRIDRMPIKPINPIMH